MNYEVHLQHMKEFLDDVAQNGLRLSDKEGMLGANENANLYGAIVDYYASLHAIDLYFRTHATSKSMKEFFSKRMNESKEKLSEIEKELLDIDYAD